MQSKRLVIILLSAVCGAAAGALIPRFGPQLGRVPALMIDRPLLAHRWLFGAAVMGWVLFSAYWEAAARNASAAQTSETRGSRSLHVLMTNVALLLIIAPLRALGRFLPVSVIIMSAGLAVEAAGLFLAIWARRHLGRNWSGEITIKVQHELVRSGPYRWLRHPIYTGILAMYVGTALVTGEWLAVVGLAIMGFAYWRKIHLEEANLNVAFGGDYEAYRRETWALVPGLF